MFKIHISSKAKRELKVIFKAYPKAIIAVLEDLQENPYIGEPLTRELTDQYSYKLGTYRIIYKVNKKDKIIRILAAGNRSTIYN